MREKEWFSQCTSYKANSKMTLLIWQVLRNDCYVYIFLLDELLNMETRDYCIKVILFPDLPFSDSDYKGLCPILLRSLKREHLLVDIRICQEVKVTSCLPDKHLSTETGSDCSPSTGTLSPTGSTIDGYQTGLTSKWPSVQPLDYPILNTVSAYQQMT